MTAKSHCFHRRLAQRLDLFTTNFYTLGLRGKVLVGVSSKTVVSKSGENHAQIFDK